MPRLLAIIALCLSPAALHCTELTLGGETLGGRWLNLIETPRGAAFGQALGAVPERVEGRAADPSALAMLDQASVSVSHHQWVEGINVQTVSGGLPLGTWGGLGLRLGSVDMGDVPLYSLSPSGGLNEYGSVRPRALSLGADWGRSLGHGLRTGVGLAWISQDLGISRASAFLGNLGLGLGLGCWRS